MKMRIVVAVAVLVLFAAVLPAQAEELLELTYLGGWVVDEGCCKKSERGEITACTMECDKKGSPLVFYSKERDRAFRIKDQKRAAAFTGRELNVMAFLTDEGGIKIGSYVEKGTKNTVVGPPQPEVEEGPDDGS